MEFKNSPTISFTTEVDFASEEFSLIFEPHPGNKDFTTLIYDGDGGRESICDIPNQDLPTLVNALRMHIGNLNLAGMVCPEAETGQ